MFQECRHILPSGRKCHSPALRGQPYCYYHTGLRQFAANQGQNKEPVAFPSLEDSSGIQIAINQILGALGASRIDPAKARVYLYGIQLASQFAERAEKRASRKDVSELCYENDEILAPAKTTCEPPQDCLKCNHRDSCDTFEIYKDDEEAESEEEDEA